MRLGKDRGGVVSTMKDESSQSNVHRVDVASTLQTTPDGPPATTLPISPTGQIVQRFPPGIRYVQYTLDLERIYLPQIRALIAKDLSEPYSIYVYRYFLYQWPQLCFLAVDTTTPAFNLIGVVICKLEPHRGGPMRGYIAMLATEMTHRGKGIAKTLVSKAVDLMVDLDADEVALEAEESNKAALTLYEGLGFLRSKKLYRYYLNGSSAYRLLLYCKEGVGMMPLDQGWDPYGQGDLPPSAGLVDEGDLLSREII